MTASTYHRRMAADLNDVNAVLRAELERAGIPEAAAETLDRVQEIAQGRR